ncbi:hypothetical protein BZA77DRAFT_316693 [Pyronema omphalodes]|nr:hypothetical protein BZA77DRAFT_316693 [Pyronema omphalodes]
MEHLWEPIATSVRFVTLLVIFAPVILTAPVILLRESKAGQSWWYAFLVQSLERAGPTFIKLGQWAASRTDIFPTELCELMSKLHSNAKAHSLHQTKKIISKAFGGRDFDEIFEEFDPVPLGVGAIAQVYKAKLAPGLLPPAEIEEQSFRKRVGGLVKSSPQDVPSSYVAIKVIHPKVDKIVNRDLRIMRFFAVLLNAVPTLEWLSFPDEVDTFSDMMRLQMDLRIEAENLGRFRANFADRTTVTFPTPYNNYTTRDVLLEEFAHGIPLEAFLESGGGPFQEEMANMGLDSFLHMLVIDNFIHSDLHPGNIMIRFLKPSPSTPGIPFFSNPAEKPDPEDVTTLVRARLLPHRRDPTRWISELTALDREGFRPQLVFIDAGLVTELSPLNRRNFLDLFRAIAEFNGYHAGELMVSRSRSPDGVLFPEQFAQKMQSLVLNVKSKTLALGNISFGDILSEVLQMVRTHHVRMEGDFVNVVISMLLLEGIGRRLDPATDLLKSALPILRAVGAGGAKSAYCGEMMEEGGVLTLLKVWVALETRQFALATVEEVERGVKYDLLSPNI